MFHDPERTVSHLLLRLHPYLFSPWALFLCFIGSFIGTSLICGLGVSAGLVIPLLYIGCAYGRFFGVVLNTFDSRIEVGVYALYGASAFLGGVTRLPLTFTVVLLELTDDFIHLIPIMVAMIFGKIVGDFLSHHTIYHGLLETRHIPFLDPQVPKTASLLLAEHVMNEPPHFFLAKPKVSQVLSTLEESPHNGFPVMDYVTCSKQPSPQSSSSSTPCDQLTLVGFIPRRTLKILLLHKVFISNPQDSLIEDIDSEGLDTNAANVTKLLYGSLIWQNAQDLPTFSDIKSKLLDSLSQATETQYLDLHPFMNPAPLVVPRNAMVSFVYEAFLTLGYTHVFVRESDGTLCGVISRKDLMEVSLQYLLENKRKIDWTYSNPQETRRFLHSEMLYQS